MPNLFEFALIWITAINIAAFLWMALDKRAARKRRRRIPERRLLWLAALGGTPGIFAAIHGFSHKTRKQPFRRYLFTILAVQIIVAGLWLAR
ncbi:DUF1294 domain-containing protein [Roseovarius sp. A21]|uniref:DUF1294 domain-containing protein n=1 Tax=Roseovarius bejariae TaxID=2576383 RepID=A0A844D0V4_9RHOB|nr:DUF1294 domain-containing protein [Roseovarius bejariae]MRU16460.1 DUF1294 domain-containing protein [Roseovarius bejariae]